MRTWARDIMTSSLKETDRCVMCGMCLPQCPTYGKTRNEADSPRGRISLMQALDRGQLEMDSHLLAHLDGCLACRACEAVCPSQVPYGKLIDAARETLRPRRPHTRLERTVRGLSRPAVEKRPVRRTLRLGLRTAQMIGIPWLAATLHLERLPVLGRALGLLPRRRLASWRHSDRPARLNPASKVGLFTGCAGEVFDGRTLEASARLLTRLGYTVVVPDAQTCCGALYAHAGEGERAERLAVQNIDAFSAQDLDAVVFTATGCGAPLSEYADRYPGEKARAFSARVEDVSHFIAKRGLLAGRRFHPLKARVALHTPCSLAHVLKGGAHPRELLRHIPGIELITLADDGRCCGAAGSYMLTQPEMADALLEDKLIQLKSTPPEYLVTSNIGCALHIQAGLRRAGLDVEVLHPVELLEKQLAD